MEKELIKHERDVTKPENNFLGEKVSVHKKANISDKEIRAAIAPELTAFLKQQKASEKFDEIMNLLLIDIKRGKRLTINKSVFYIEDK